MEINKLYLSDNGNGNVEVKLNNHNITPGILEYNLYRIAEENEALILDLKMKVIPEYINIQLKKNSKSSSD